MSFTHFDESGRGKMVDISEKKITVRKAIATGKISMQQETISLIKAMGVKKGDVLGVAQVAAIMAAKNTSSIIPMCHNIPLEGVDIAFEVNASSITIRVTVTTTGKTGAEMEALTAASVGLLTIYDMCKAHDKTMEMGQISLVAKSGGKSDFGGEHG